MRILMFAATAILVGMMGAGSAEAAQGCGAGFHRGYYGYCHPSYYGPADGYGGPAYRPDFYHHGSHWHRWWHRW